MGLGVNVVKIGSGGLVLLLLAASVFAIGQHGKAKAAPMSMMDSLVAQQQIITFVSLIQKADLQSTLLSGGP